MDTITIRLGTLNKDDATFLRALLHRAEFPKGKRQIKRIRFKGRGPRKHLVQKGHWDGGKWVVDRKGVLSSYEAQSDLPLKYAKKIAVYIDVDLEASGLVSSWRLKEIQQELEHAQQCLEEEKSHHMSLKEKVLNFVHNLG